MLNNKVIMSHDVTTTVESRLNFCFLIIGISFIIRLFFLQYYNLLVEEAYYWNFAQHLDFGYLDHPPLVAYLINITTRLFGVNELGVRIGALLCWVGTAFFSFRLTELINAKAASYSVLLLSILPFFFLQSLAITPDQPLIFCWSAALYFFYRIFIKNEAKYWYFAGVSIGLGALAKYSIIVLVPPVFLFMVVVPEARHWFLRKEPYLGALISILLFTPVIYWNYTHHWVSFIFQTTRRFEIQDKGSFDLFIVLLFTFLMPLGVLGLLQLFHKKSLDRAGIAIKTRRFLQLFTLFPLYFFGIFSLHHGIKFNWIGPGLLAVIPWIAIIISNNQTIRKVWYVAGGLLLLGYTGFLGTISFARLEQIPGKFLIKFIDWENFTGQLYAIANQYEKDNHQTPVFIPLDSYYTASELSFYQSKFLNHNEIQHTYPVAGNAAVGFYSLMFEFWTKRDELVKRPLILITNEIKDFDTIQIKQLTNELAAVKTIWSYSQGNGKGAKIQPYYYKIVELK